MTCSLDDLFQPDGPEGDKRGSIHKPFKPESDPRNLEQANESKGKAETSDETLLCNFLCISHLKGQIFLNKQL